MARITAAKSDARRKKRTSTSTSRTAVSRSTARQPSYESSSSDVPVVVAALTGKNADRPTKKSSHNSKKPVARKEDESASGSEDDAPVPPTRKHVEQSYGEEEEEYDGSQPLPESDGRSDSDVEEVEVQPMKARKGRGRPPKKINQRVRAIMQ